MAASNDDFVIKEHTYKMCPECPMFSIPIPIPKSASEDNIQNKDYFESGHSRQANIFGQIQGFFTDAKTTLSKLLQVNQFSGDRRISTGGYHQVTQKSQHGRGISPLVIAGVAALGLGVATIMSVGGVAVGRAFGHNNHLITNSLNQLDKIDYDTSDLICVPRNYCENLKRKKYLIDQFPVAKKIGVGIAEIIWDKDHVSEKGSGSKTLCNLRECIFSLLR